MASQEARKLDFFSTPHQAAIRELLDSEQLAGMGDKAVSVFRLVTSAQIRRLLGVEGGISRFPERDLYALLRLDEDKLEILEPHLSSVREGFIVDYRDLPLRAIETVTVEQLMRDDPEHLKAFREALADDKDGELMNNPGYSTLFELPTRALQNFGKAIFQDSRLLEDLQFYAGESGSIWSKHLDIRNGTVAKLLGHRSKEVQAFYRAPENLRLALRLVGDDLRLTHLLSIPLNKVQTLGLNNLVDLSENELQALASFPLETVELIGLKKYRSLDANARWAVGKVDVEIVRIVGIDTLEELVSRTPDSSEVLKRKCTVPGSTGTYEQFGREVSSKSPDRIDISRISPKDCLQVLNLLSTEKLEKLGGEEKESLLDSTVSDLEAMLMEELESRYGYSRSEAQEICSRTCSIVKGRVFILIKRAFTLDVLGQGLDPEKISYCLNNLSSSGYFFLKRVLDLGSIGIKSIIQTVRAIDNSDSSEEALESLFQQKGSVLSEAELRAFLETKRQELIKELGPWADTSDNPTETLTADEIRSWGSHKADYPKQTAAWRRAVATLPYQIFLNPPNCLLYVDPEVIEALTEHIASELVLRIGVPNLREMTHADIMRVLAQKDELLETDVYQGES